MLTNPQSKNQMKLEVLIKTFAYFILIPSLVVTFVISLMAPALRTVLADYLALGFVLFALLFVGYAAWLYVKARRK